MSGWWRECQTLLNAVKYGLTDRVQALLLTADGLTQCAESSSVLLSLAVSHGHLDIVRALLETGICDANEPCPDEQQNPPLLVACVKGDVAVVELLLDHGAAVDGDGGNKTPLSVAASFGRAECIDVLVRHGAVVDRRFGEDYTALLEAARNGHLHCVQTLVRLGANVSHTCVCWWRAGREYTALEWAREDIRDDVCWYFETDLPQRIANARQAVLCLVGLRKFHAAGNRFLTFVPREIVLQMALLLWQSRFDEAWCFFHLNLVNES
jgi:ankyrin repeat protein